MSYEEALSRSTIAISVSESPDMSILGLSESHLRDAMAEIARHLLALGGRLAYGGDLRANGFSELLYELIARHRRDASTGDSRLGVINYLAWPVHISMESDALASAEKDSAGLVELVYLNMDGTPLLSPDRLAISAHLPGKTEWIQGLTSMRETMQAGTHARIVLGGRVTNFLGKVPGIAEEAALSLQARQPLFLLGGFGGCARDICETLGLVEPWFSTRRDWLGRRGFDGLNAANLCNGLSVEENKVLARTPHVDEAVTLILRGLVRLRSDPQRLDVMR